MNTAASSAATARQIVRASPSHTAATIDHSSRLLRWFGWRRLPVARPGMAEAATQVPSGQAGANTCTRPMALLATPATTRAMQKARNAGAARPHRAAAAATATVSIALAIAPAEDSDSDQGADSNAEAPSAARTRAASDTSKAVLPVEAGQAVRGSAAPSTSRKVPQPTNAAAWLRKVADGETLKATSVGSTTANEAIAIQSAWRGGRSTSERGMLLIQRFSAGESPGCATASHSLDTAQHSA